MASRRVICINVGPFRAFLTLCAEVKIIGLQKATLNRLPDVFVVISIDGEQMWKSGKLRKTLDPCWEDNVHL
jgi:hypothetical protein